jgi:hypothetical protein
MATKITCDICEKEITKAVQVEFNDGEHPHNGSRMTKNADVCLDCIVKVPSLQSFSEFDEMVGNHEVSRKQG